MRASVVGPALDSKDLYEVINGKSLPKYLRSSINSEV